MSRYPRPAIATTLALCCFGVASSAEDRLGDVLAQARHAIGIDAPKTSVTSLTVDATVQRALKSGAIDISSQVHMDFMLPDKYRRTEAVSMGPVSRTVTTGLSGDGLLYDDGGVAKMMGADPLAPGPQRVHLIANLKLEAFRQLTIWLLSPPADAPCTWSYAGVAEAPDGKADVIDVKGEQGRNMRLFLDTNSHQLLMATYVVESPDPEQVKALTERLVTGAASNPGGTTVSQSLLELDKLPKKTVTVHMHFSDYRRFGPLTLPSRMMVDLGDAREDWTISSFTLNPALKAELFRGAR
jgi:hypothetical protein